MEKIIICALPGVNVDPVHDLLRAHDHTVADDAVIIENFANELVDEIEKSGNVKNILKLYEAHNITVISDIPAMLFLRELIDKIPGMCVYLKRHVKHMYFIDCKVIFVQQPGRPVHTKSPNFLNKTWYEWLIIYCGLKGPEYRNYYYHLFPHYLKCMFSMTGEWRTWTAHPISVLQSLSDANLNNKCASITDIILVCIFISRTFM